MWLWLCQVAALPSAPFHLQNGAERAVRQVVALRSDALLRIKVTPPPPPPPLGIHPPPPCLQNGVERALSQVMAVLQDTLLRIDGGRVEAFRL